MTSSSLRRLFPSVLGILVIASMASFDALDWRRRTSLGSEKYMKFIADWDNEYHTAAGNSGLFLRFQNLKGKAEQECARVYFLGVYVLYPETVLSAPNGAVINRFEDVVATNFQPDDGWLIAHGIGTVLHVDGSKGYCNPLPMIYTLRPGATQPATSRQ